MYQLYKCKVCNEEFIIIKEHTDFICCPYCESVKVRKEGKYEDLKKCMESIPNRDYKKGVSI